MCIIGNGKDKGEYRYYREGRGHILQGRAKTRKGKDREGQAGAVPRKPILCLQRMSPGLHGT